MTAKSHDWASGLEVAITVTDAEGVILEMNPASIATFGASGGAALVGTQLRACHPASAVLKLDRLYQGQQANHYTIRKAGRRKIIHQLPWYQEGRFAGLVELSIPIPDELPEFLRD